MGVIFWPFLEKSMGYSTGNFQKYKMNKERVCIDQLTCDLYCQCQCTEACFDSNAIECDLQIANKIIINNVEIIKIPHTHTHTHTHTQLYTQQ